MTVGEGSSFLQANNKMKKGKSKSGETKGIGFDMASGFKQIVVKNSAAKIKQLYFFFFSRNFASFGILLSLICKPRR